MNNLRISVITVCFNAADTIERTIMSVLHQTYKNIEYLIIDGGSIDGTTDIIQKYESHISFWISEPDKGIYDAMNKGIDKASGDYLYFIGSDDVLYSDKTIELVVQKIEDDLSNVYYGDVILQPSGRKYDGKFSKFDLIRHNICHQAIFYPKTVLKKYPFELSFPAYSDYYENILLWGKKVKFVYIPLTICNFYVGGFSLGGDAEFFNNRARIVKKNLGVLSFIYYIIRIKFIHTLVQKFRTNFKD